MAEVMKFQDFKEEGSENAVKVSHQGASGDEGKSPVISGADSHHTAPTANALHLDSREEITAHTPAPHLTSQLMLALNTAILLQLCISLSQSTLTGSP